MDTMNNIMIDIETLGTSNNALITQVGACYFDRQTGIIGDKFSMNVQIQDGLNNGFEVDAGAIKFWLEHTPTFLKEAVPVKEMLGKLREFISKKTLIWSHATFDAVILKNAYRRFKEKTPFSFRNVRDIRTLVDLAHIKYKKKEGDDKSHDALEDCIYQVKYCCECFKKLKED